MICPGCGRRTVPGVAKSTREQVYICVCGRVHDKKRRVLWRFRYVGVA